MLQLCAANPHVDQPLGTQQQQQQQLEGLCAAEMLVRDPDGRAGSYLFKHSYLKDVSYMLLPEELKEKLHTAAAAPYTKVQDYYKTIKVRLAADYLEQADSARAARHRVRLDSR